MADVPAAKWGLRSTTALLVTMAAVVALAMAVPVFRVILLISLPLGAVVAAGLYLWHKKRPIKEPKDESIHLDLK
ncbi:MAG TPA: hypothetical protein VMS96_06125 [Terriglobales bacterium]|nr:hypothetical protein [Terriglobales bacterium]